MNEGEVKEAITFLWNESSATYDDHHGHGIKTQEERDAWKAVFRKVIPGESLQVLDVGAGTGEISLLLAEMGHEVVGLDLSPKMIGMAKSKAKATGIKAEFQVGDAENPQFGEEEFDVVINRHLLWTLAKPEQAIKEWNRILRVGGKLIIIDGLWRDFTPWDRMRQLLRDLIILVVERKNPRKNWYSKDLRSILPHPYGASQQWSEEYLKSAGFGNIAVLNLEDIMKIQRRNMPHRERLTYNFRYYLISGEKLNMREEKE